MKNPSPVRSMMKFRTLKEFWDDYRGTILQDLKDGSIQLENIEHSFRAGALAYIAARNNLIVSAPSEKQSEIDIHRLDSELLAVSFELNKPEQSCLLKSGN